MELRTNDATTIPFKSDITYDSVVHGTGDKPDIDPKDPATGAVNSVTITYTNGSAVTQPIIGETLKANAFCSATDVACSGTISYQWMKDNNGDGTFVAIPGATSQTYILVGNPSTGGDQKDKIKVTAVRTP